ncbi:MAG: DNA mismatch repair protein MutL [Desulfobulbus propionicus]|nr:MAG: DNA mismatch repair protein MutL [Desulfobulbus propionicus]
MSRIRILSEHLSNQIAAGEVVERPASVVKELIENSIDAGASQIDVHIEGSGVRLIRVADNGCGMVEDDVLMCIERHATSKLQDESQLGAIATLGFRGEALPSIGSVSKMIILSRTQDRDAGTRAEVRYGVLRVVHEDGCSKGTIIEVRNLFGNVPARKKFLKTARTEAFHVEEVVKNQALAMPGIGFTLRFDERLVLDCPAGSDLEQRVRSLFRYSGQLLSLEHSGATVSEQLAVGGYLLLPEAMTSQSAKLRIIVNGRPVQDRMIRNAVVEGLHGFLMKGYQPAGAIVLAISPELVDVNVHPAKREIRFRDHRTVHQMVKQIVQKAIQKHQELTRTALFSSPESPNSEKQPEAGNTEPFTISEPAPIQHRLENFKQPPLRTERPPVTAPSFQGKDQGTPIRSDERSVSAAGEPSSISQPVAPPESFTAQPSSQYGGLRVIGQLFSLYLLCEREEQFVVIDQHAAHERIVYGQLKQGYLAKDIPLQKLLFPVSVELGPDHMETVERHQDTLSQLGFDVFHFGDTTWVIKGVPAVASVLDPAATLYELLDTLQDQGKQASEAAFSVVVDDLLASMACKAAIKAGNKLLPEEMINLLHQMEESDVFSHCPHGRPVLKTFSPLELEKWFHRHGG